MLGEFQLIQRLKSLIPRRLQGPRGIGDDCAVLPSGGGKSLLFTTDALVEGVDFRMGKGGVSPEAIGYKALAVNLSDIAAMGGRPTAFVVAWGIPKKFSPAQVEKIARGILRLARFFRVAWVGGDISKASRFFISIALLGEASAEKVVERRGARPGDLIYVTGRLGGSIQGKHLSFTPRLAEARFLVSRFRPTAMIDVSDGFIQDLGHILDASRAAARVDLDRIPISQAVRRRALQSALTDGEDFELLFTISRRVGTQLEKAWKRKFPRLPLTRVGEIRRGKGAIEWRQQGKKVRLWFRKKGFTHF